MPTIAPSPRLAGALYVLIIFCGLTAELALRGPAVAAADMNPHVPALRLSLVADLVMLLADIALALLFFHLLRPFGAGLAQAAMVFRLGQAALIGAALVLFSVVPALVQQGQADLARLFVSLHANGYDIGLVLFGINAFLMAALLSRTLIPRVLPPMLMASGAVYIAGGVLRLVAPDAVALLEPAYLICIVTESALAIWLLITRRFSPRSEAT